MVFNSLQFAIFFPFAAIIYYYITPRFKPLWLLVASWLFYACWSVKYLIILILITIITYISSLIIEKKQKKWVFIASIIVLLSPLLALKYGDFFVEKIFKTINEFTMEYGFRIVSNDDSPILPIGLSFFTLQSLGYLIDIYKKKYTAEKNYVICALFISFFPTINSGPIERGNHLIPQLKENHCFNYYEARRGLLIFLWGLFIKLAISNKCSIISDAIFNNYNDYSGITLIIGAIVYSVQIFCDFLSYSTMAIGISETLGIRVLSNFKQPYFALSIKDFWRRWHISLSTWFKDYVYIPLGGNRCGKLRNLVNVFITFILSGLWHGANWSFIAWGALHGVYQVIEIVLQNPINSYINKHDVNTNIFLVKFVRWLKTYALVVIAWVFFRTSTVKDALRYLYKCTQLHKNGSSINILKTSLGLNSINIFILLLCILLLLFVEAKKEKGATLHLFYKQPRILQFICYWVIVFLITISLNSSSQEFVYFQF